jgi:hypothetical protein
LREAGYSDEDITEMVKNQVTRTSEK